MKFWQIHGITALFLLVAASGCAPGRMPLKDGLAESITELSVVSFVPDAEPVARVEQATTGSSMFGLIGAIADAAVTSSRGSKASDRAFTLRASVKDLDQRAVIWDALSASADSARWPGKIEVERIGKVAPAQGSHNFRKFLEEHPAPAHLFLDTQCYLSPGGVNLVLYTQAKLYAKAFTPSYRMDFWYVSAPMGTGEDTDSYDRWARDDGAPYRKCLKQGAATLANMLQRDLLGGGEADEDLSQQEHSYEMGSLDGVTKSIKWKGRVVDVRDGLLYVRGKSGFLYAFPPAACETDDDTTLYVPAASRSISD
jgi:hypothetical protein